MLYFPYLFPRTHSPNFKSCLSPKRRGNQFSARFLKPWSEEQRAGLYLQLCLIFFFFFLQIFPLISQSRRLVKRGELTALEYNLSLKWKLTTRPIYLHLFNDYLLLSRPREYVLGEKEGGCTVSQFMKGEIDLRCFRAAATGSFNLS